MVNVKVGDTARFTATKGNTIRITEGVVRSIESDGYAESVDGLFMGFVNADKVEVLKSARTPHKPGTIIQLSEFGPSDNVRVLGNDGRWRSTAHGYEAAQLESSYDDTNMPYTVIYEAEEV